MTNATLYRTTDLEQRLASCIPGGTLELEAFVRLVEIRETTEIPTAAVTTGATSRLLLNPEFIEKYCATDEHLFLLVMHELWHVLFAHTRLSTRPTVAENIAFDAIINAELTRQFPQIQYRGFFEAINPSDC
jgi:predicted metal-dependent peptidase